MPGTNPETLAFFAPGLLHQFGNLWLSIDGHASLLGGPADELERTRTALLGVTREGRACLDVMRFLAGEPSTARRPLVRVLDELVAVARVPLRERQYAIVMHEAGAHGDAAVDPACVVVMTAEAIRRLVDALPPGATGTIVVGSGGDADGAPRVLVYFEATPGTLPFPLAENALPAIGELAASQRSPVACEPCRGGFSLRFCERIPASRPGSFR